MHIALLAVHILVAIAVIGLVLIQHGKGADAGAAFGAGAAGGASGSVFGAQGAGNFLSRSTAILAAIFFLTSLTMAYMSQSKEAPTSLMEKAAPAPVTQTMDSKTDAPVVPDSGAADSGTATDSGTTSNSDVPENP
jgi:preprotein translocase subunit SecG